MAAVARDILIIKLGALGDVLRTTALLEPLRRRHGPCRIWWLTDRAALPLLAGQGLAGAAARPGPLLPRGRAAYDLLVNLDEDPRACRWASRLPARRRIGAYEDETGALRYTPDSAPYFRLGLLNRSPDGTLSGADRLKRANRKAYQRLWAEVLGLDLSAYPAAYDLRLPVSAAGRREARRLLGASEKAWIGLNAGAGERWPSKRLSVEKAAALSRALSRRGWEPVLLGGRADAAHNRAIRRLAGTGAVATSPSLPVFAALLERCRAVVTTDSLALHLASALRRPVVALFGPTAPREIELYGRGVKLEAGSPCGCFYRPLCPRGHCLDALAPDEVLRALDRVLAAGPRA